MRALRASLLAAGVTVIAMAARAEDPQRAALVADWGAMQGAMQATAQAMAHTADDLKAALARLDQVQKDEAELDYWRRYFAGLQTAHAK